MIISQWNAADTLFVEDYDAAMAAIEADAKRVDATHVGDEYATTLDDEMLLELNRERAEHDKFSAGLNNNLVSGDYGPDVSTTEMIERDKVLTSDEEDAEVGRVWGIDASRVEDGE